MSDHPIDARYELAAELAEAKAQLAEAERDAARYRWLRRLDAGGLQVYSGMDDASIFGGDLDNAVDAAMSATVSADDEPPTCKWCGKAFYSGGDACRTCVPVSAPAVPRLVCNHCGSSLDHVLAPDSATDCPHGKANNEWCEKCDPEGES
jgi:hypothetical protein